LSRRKHVRLELVGTDASPAFRVTIPRSVVIAGLVALVLLSAVVGAFTADRLGLQVGRNARRHVERIAEQRAALTAIKQKLGELRQEMAGWRDIHARLYDAFGPDHALEGRDKGIGGPPGPVHRLLARLSPKDELDRLAESIAEESRSLQTLDRLMARAGKMLATLPSRWPVRGPVNSEFGSRLSPWTKATEFHAGMDIRAERGTQVRAPAAGVVVIAGPQAEYGLAVILDHGEDIRTIYAHLSRVGVAVGQKVERGAELGLTGNTGRSSGPHLHYEILVKGQPVNPRAYLWD
jgi:murein DD-endopeptidase MepM/ murein hydrolase activator NlpD